MHKTRPDASNTVQGNASDPIAGSAVDGTIDPLIGGPGDPYWLEGGTTTVGSDGEDWFAMRLQQEGGATVTGGAGADHYGFESIIGIPGTLNIPASSVATPLYITDFNLAEGDRFDLYLWSYVENGVPIVWRGNAASGFDAVVGQSVALAGEASGGLDVWQYYDAEADRTVLFADVDRNGVVDERDLRIEFAGVLALDTLAFNTVEFNEQVGTPDADTDTVVPLGSGDDFGYGFEGNDTLDAAAGNDTLFGGSGNDELHGGAGVDSLDGGAGNDLMEGGLGDDRYVVDAVGDVVVEASGEGYDQVLTSLASYALGANFEYLHLTSTGAANGYGNALDNYILAGVGDNVINGGSGVDTVSYTDATAGVSIYLALTTAQATGGSGNDTLLNIENLRGSIYDDTLRGNGIANNLNGSAGNDSINGGGGNDALFGSGGSDTLEGSTGDDHIDGGSSLDTVSYATAGSGITLNLALAAAQATGGAGSDTLVAIENIVGSAYADALRGNSHGNRIEGGNGSDWLLGGGGADVIGGGIGADVIVFASTADSTLAAMDTVLDFNRFQGDKLDVSRIDADAVLAGNQAFTFIGTAAFSADATGQLRYAGGVVYGSTDADADAEFALALTGAPALLAADFLL